MTAPHKLHILCPPLTDQNVRAFVAPLIATHRELGDLGIRVAFRYGVSDDLTDCDTLILNSAFWRGPWIGRRDEALPLIADLAGKVPRLLFFDRASTSGTANADVLPLVTRYYKTNLLRDRTLYMRSLYGLREFTDYYHREFDVQDEHPALSPAVKDAYDLKKLRLSWSTALADYSLFGPRLSALYSRLPLSWLMRPSRRFHPPQASRSVALSCRMGLTYKYETVAYQRRRIAEILTAHRRTDRISKFAYARELRQSQIVASPFGYSEVNYKDFETFLAGAALLKPDMSHLETYPDLFQEGETYIAHRWDFADLQEKIDGLLEDRTRRLAIAEAGQQLYRAVTVGRAAREHFAGYVDALLREADAPLH